jgi:predicted ester cyclase/quinol monooxygenase YgiN
MWQLAMRSLDQWSDRSAVEDVSVSKSDGFAVYAKLTAHPGQRDLLIAELVAAARAAVGRDVGALACSVNTVEREPDAVWVAETWPDRPTHDASAHGPALADITRRVRRLLATPPVHAYGEVAALVIGKNEPRADGAPDQMRDIGQRLYAALDAHDWAVLETLVAADVLVQLGSSPPIGLEQWRRNHEMFHTAFPDGHHVIDHCVVDGDQLVTRCRFQGTHTGAFGEVQPTGASVSVGVIHIDRFRNGQLVEHRGQLDMLGLHQQINAA